MNDYAMTAQERVAFEASLALLKKAMGGKANVRRQQRSENEELLYDMLGRLLGWLETVHPEVHAKLPEDMLFWWANARRKPGWTPESGTGEVVVL